MPKNNIKLERVNFILDHEDIDFVGYEFWIKGHITIDESGCDQALFRLHVYKESGEVEVVCAYSEDYDIMEEATEYFDLNKIQKEIHEYIEKVGSVDNHGSAYVKYCQLNDEGYDSEDSITMCYENEEGLISA